jgi:flagellar hook-basal body complex protein FliE
MAAITPISAITVPQMPQVATGGGQAGDFSCVMQAAIGKVEQYRADANQSVENFLSGESGELHTTVLATQRAELALEMFMQTRNKVVQAYQEIMRMQL